MTHETGLFPEPISPTTAPLYEAPLAHQRPEGVNGEWELVAPENRNIHQRIAAATNGWVTLPTVVSLAGAEITRRGINNATEGLRERSVPRVAKGVGQVVVGRTFDLVDGWLAKKLHVRGKAGALVDATLDKALAVHAEVKLAKNGIISPLNAATTVAEQAIITGENVAIEKFGGQPNPKRSGKIGMFAIWQGVGLRIMQKGAELLGKPRTAKALGGAALTSEFGAHGLNFHAAGSYGNQLISTIRNKSAK